MNVALTVFHEYGQSDVMCGKSLDQSIRSMPTACRFSTAYGSVMNDAGNRSFMYSLGMRARCTSRSSDFECRR